MRRKFRFMALACLLLLPAGLIGSVLTSATTTVHSSLSSSEQDVISRVNGTNIYDYDLELEKIGLNHSLSGYSFRSSGSAGATEAAKWIRGQFESYGLETHIEPFEFTTWNLPTQPLLVIDTDGDQDTTNDQVTIQSFQPEHYSWPTPDGGAFAPIVNLPLPALSRREDVGNGRYDAAAWNAVNTTGKILFVGREVRAGPLHLAFKNKLTAQPPAAIIFTYWYDWMSWAPPGLNSIGGLPASTYGAYYWNSKIPVGWVNYQDGLWIRNKMATANISASVTVSAVIAPGTHQNIVATLPGSKNPEKTIIISGHYDTVVTPGFCDNGAGTAGVLELARVFAEAARQNAYKPEYTLLFIAFAGEELSMVGAIEYMRQHESELKNTAALINLDCIGGEYFEMTETFTDDNGLNLEEVVHRAADDLGVKVKLIEPTWADQEAFRNPVATDEDYSLWWGSKAGIRNVTRVKSSILIDSYPLFISDKWDNGTAGWIHTPYDNSTSSETPGGVNAEQLESHTQVAALSTMRVLSTLLSPFLIQVYSVTSIVCAAAAVLIYLRRTRVTASLRKLTKSVLSHIGMKELLYIIILTVLFLFLSFALYMKIGRTEIIDQGYPVPVNVTYFGAPLSMFGVVQPSSATGTSLESQIEWTQEIGGRLIFQQDGLLLNTALFAFLAFVLTYLVMRLTRRREYAGL